VASLHHRVAVLSQPSHRVSQPDGEIDRSHRREELTELGLVGLRVLDIARSRRVMLDLEGMSDFGFQERDEFEQ